MQTIRQAVITAFQKRFGEQMQPTDRLEDRGVNSIQLMVSLEDTLGVALEDAQLNVKRYETLEDVIAYIESLGRPE